MNLGAEPKKVAMLGGLLLVAAVLLYVNLFSDDSEPSNPSSAARPNISGKPLPPPGGSIVAPKPPSRQGRQPEFRPSLKRSPDDPLDASKVDPSLRMEVLAKLQAVTMPGSGRNLFEFGSAPPPPPLAATAKGDPKKVEPKIFIGPMPPPPPPVKTEPVKPQAPPIPLKFYGFISTPRGAQRRGFFLDGDEIMVAGEGDTIRRRYKVVRIGLNSVEMEDLNFNQTQTLRLAEVPGTG